MTTFTEEPTFDGKRRFTSGVHVAALRVIRTLIFCYFSTYFRHTECYWTLMNVFFLSMLYAHGPAGPMIVDGRDKVLCRSLEEFCSPAVDEYGLMITKTGLFDL